MSTPEPPESPDPSVPPAPPVPPGPGGYYAQPYVAYTPQPPTDGAGIAAFVIGIVGLTFACAYGFGLILSPAALFIGRSSMKRIDASQGTVGGRGFAQAGFIMGIVGTVLLVLLVVAVAVFLTALFSTDCFGDGC